MKISSFLCRRLCPLGYFLPICYSWRCLSFFLSPWKSKAACGCVVYVVILREKSVSGRRKQNIWASFKWPDHNGRELYFLSTLFAFKLRLAERFDIYLHLLWKCGAATVYEKSIKRKFWILFHFYDLTVGYFVEQQIKRDYIDVHLRRKEEEEIDYCSYLFRHQ